MSKDFTRLVAANLIFILIYMLIEAIQYDGLRHFNKTAVTLTLNLPWYIIYAPVPNNGPIQQIYFMFQDFTSIMTAVLFLIAIGVNLYLAYRMQKTKVIPT
jgi:hypothetical protein